MSTMSVATLCLALSFLFPVVSSLFLENANNAELFRFQWYGLGGQLLPTLSEYALIEKCLVVQDISDAEGLAQEIYLTLHSVNGQLLPWGVQSIARTSLYSSLSHILNACTSSQFRKFNDGPLSVAQKEVLYHAALAMDPLNVLVIKNYAFYLEWKGCTSLAQSLFDTCVVFTGDIGCAVHYIYIAPPLLWDRASQPQQLFDKMLHNAEGLILYLCEKGYDSGSASCYLPKTYSHLPARDSHIYRTLELYDVRCPRATGACNSHVAIRSVLSTDPLGIIRELPLNLQYIGMPTRILYESLSEIMQQLSPSISTVAIATSQPTALVSNTVLRLGIVSEHDSNSSPMLCFAAIVEQLMQSPNIHSSTDGSMTMHITYFARHGPSPTIFEQLVREVVSNVVFIDPFNVELSQLIIAQEQIDVLLYLALPTEKYTFLLAHSRLAPIQIQYGIGHPISSGLSSIDYSVVSSLMVSAADPKGCEVGSVTTCRDYSAVTTASTNVSVTASSWDYSEQTIMFDSLGKYNDNMSL